MEILGVRGCLAIFTFERNKDGGNFLRKKNGYFNRWVRVDTFCAKQLPQLSKVDHKIVKFKIKINFVKK